MASLSTTPRLAIYVDGANMDRGAKNNSIHINLVRFHAWLVGNRNVVIGNYYDSKTTHGGKKAYYARVEQAGFKLILGPEILPQRKQKEVDVQIAVDIVSDSYDDRFDVALLASGDGDLAPAVRKVLTMKKQVEVASFNYAGSNEFAWSLKSIATRSIDLTYDAKKIM